MALQNVFSFPFHFGAHSGASKNKMFSMRTVVGRGVWPIACICSRDSVVGVELQRCPLEWGAYEEIIGASYPVS